MPPRFSNNNAHTHGHHNNNNNNNKIKNKNVNIGFVVQYVVMENYVDLLMISLEIL